MAILGLLLLLAAAGLTVDVVIQNTSSINVDSLGQTLTLSSGWLFVAAVVTGAVGLLGVTMLSDSRARAHGRRVALAESQGAAHGLQTKRDRLFRELDHERAGRASTVQAPKQGNPTAGQGNRPVAVDLASAERGADGASTEDTRWQTGTAVNRSRPAATASSTAAISENGDSGVSRMPLLYSGVAPTETKRAPREGSTPDCEPVGSTPSER